MTTKELREKAAQIIEERGWCQRISEDANGCVCVTRALALAADALPDSFVAHLRAYDELCVEVGDSPGIGILAGWNDRTARTKEQVIARLRGVSA